MDSHHACGAKVVLLAICLLSTVICRQQLFLRLLLFVVCWCRCPLHHINSAHTVISFAVCLFLPPHSPLAVGCWCRCPSHCMNSAHTVIAPRVFVSNLPPPPSWLGLVRLSVRLGQAIKGMDDNTLNVHLSSLCNSLTDAANDVIKVGGSARLGSKFKVITPTSTLNTA